MIIKLSVYLTPSGDSPKYYDPLENAYRMSNEYQMAIVKIRAMKIMTDNPRPVNPCHHI